MNLNRTVHFQQAEDDMFSNACMKESIVEIDPSGGVDNHLTVINDYEEWGDDNDLTGLISTRNSFNLVSRLWTVYIIIVVVMMCVLIYTFVKEGGSTSKYDTMSGEPWAFDI